MINFKKNVLSWWSFIHSGDLKYTWLYIVKNNANNLGHTQIFGRVGMSGACRVPKWGSRKNRILAKVRSKGTEIFTNILGLVN